MGEPYGYAIARMLRRQLGAHSAADHVIALEDANAALVAENEAVRAIHQPYEDYPNLLCQECEVGWPCPTARATDSVTHIGGKPQ